MTEWRRTASQQAQDDLDALLAFALDRAVELIKQPGDFVPFAAAVPAGGGCEVIAEGAGRYDRARQQAGRYRAAAFASLVTAGGAAVRIEGEHREGAALLLEVPYRRAFLGGVKLGTMRLSAGAHHVWRC